MKISIRKLSEELGYSVATISNALNYKSNVGKETAEKIRKYASDYGYLSTSPINKIRFIIYNEQGSVVSDTPFFASLISGVEDECKTLGYPLVITYLNRLSSNYDNELSAILNDKSSGNILLATEITRENLFHFSETTSPFVVLDAWFPDFKFNTIQIGNQDSVCEAVTHLLKKGHREIGYLKSNVRIRNFKERHLGYSQALLSYGINPVNQSEVLLTPTISEAYEEFKAYLKTNPTLPSAFFADNDIIAFACLRAFSEFGVKVPSDVSIIGFDDISFAEICIPPLTTIKVPKKELGAYAVRRIQELSKNNDTTTLRSLLSCELILRDSVSEK